MKVKGFGFWIFLKWKEIMSFYLNKYIKKNPQDTWVWYINLIPFSERKKKSMPQASSLSCVSWSFLRVFIFLCFVNYLSSIFHRLKPWHYFFHVFEIQMFLISFSETKSYFLYSYFHEILLFHSSLHLYMEPNSFNH